MRDLLGTVARSALIGALVGLPILGAGGRILMRFIALWQGTAPGFSVGGTVTVLFMGMVYGAVGGAVHGLARSFVHNIIARNILFAVLCTAVTWRVANVLPPRDRFTFVALTFVYIIAMELIAARRAQRTIFAQEPAPSNPTT